MIWEAKAPAASSQPGSVNLVTPAPATEELPGDKVLAVRFETG
mgnify:CR=1 FL=1